MTSANGGLWHKAVDANPAGMSADHRPCLTGPGLQMVGALSEKLMSSVGKCSWDPAHWRFRAEEARTVADQMTHEEARSIMRRIANDYGRLAKLAELADQGPIGQRSFDERAIEGGMASTGK